MDAIKRGRLQAASAQVAELLHRAAADPDRQLAEAAKWVLDMLARLADQRRATLARAHMAVFLEQGEPGRLARLPSEERARLAAALSAQVREAVDPEGRQAAEAALQALAHPRAKRPARRAFLDNPVWELPGKLVAAAAGALADRWAEERLGKLVAAKRDPAWEGVRVALPGPRERPGRWPEVVAPVVIRARAEQVARAR